MSERSLYQCSQCGEHKPPDRFHRDKDKKSGLTTRCKECRLAAQGRYREENKERLQARSRKYENSDRRRAYKRTWYAENRERERERARKKYEKYKEQYREYQRQWGKTRCVRRLVSGVGGIRQPAISTASSPTDHTPLRTPSHFAPTAIG
jgi:hypothetical protein